MQAADVVIPRIRDRRRRIAFGTRDHHQAAVALEVHVHAGPVAARTVMTVARHADVDQFGMSRAQTLVTESQPFHYPGAEIFDHDIRRRGQARCDSLAGFVLQVDGDGPFAAVGVQV